MALFPELPFSLTPSNDAEKDRRTEERRREGGGAEGKGRRTGKRDWMEPHRARLSIIFLRQLDDKRLLQDRGRLSSWWLTEWAVCSEDDALLLAILVEGGLWQVDVGLDLDSDVRMFSNGVHEKAYLISSGNDLAICEQDLEVLHTEVGDSNNGAGQSNPSAGRTNTYPMALHFGPSSFSMSAHVSLMVGDWPFGMTFPVFESLAWGQWTSFAVCQRCAQQRPFWRRSWSVGTHIKVDVANVEGFERLFETLRDTVVEAPTDLSQHLRSITCRHE